MLTHRLGYMDALRGFAICGVVLVHVGQQVNGLPSWAVGFSNVGARGVILFFIVSSFTLMWANNGKAFEPYGFYAKRFFRIAPMFYIAIAFYLWFKGTAPQPFAPNGIGVTDIVLTILLMHGLAPSSINSVVPGGWSIASEWMFYLLFPLLTIYAKTTSRAIYLLMLSLAVAIVSRLAIGAYWQEGQDGLISAFSYFSFLYSLPAFISGILLFRIVNNRDINCVKENANVMLIVVLGVIVVIGVANNSKLQNQLLMIPILSGLVLFSHYTSLRIINNVCMRYLGDISFSVYIIHFAVIHYLKKSDILTYDGVVGLIVLYVMTLSISAALASVTYRLIELPMISIGRGVAKSISIKKPV